MNNFSDLGFSSQVIKVLPELGFFEPSPIQLQAIPVLIKNDKDFIGLAQTGTGKTAAFGLPLLDALDPDKKHTQALILAPTRELGQQIANQMVAFAKYMPKIIVQAVYGGASINQQINELRKFPQIIVATPGRLIDLIERKAIRLNMVSHVILDEADEMLNMGFKEDIDKILSFTPENKLTWLFSATMPKEIRKIVNKYMENPVEIKVNPDQEINENIEHQYAIVKSSDKVEALKRFLDVHANMRGLIFCRTKLNTQSLAEELTKQHYMVDALHGDLSQYQRDRVMNSFKNHTLKVLVATDVAARGIDVKDLTHIIHYSLPDDKSYYTHRSGRTARAGKTGISLSLVTKRDMEKIYMFENKLGIKFKKVPIPNVENILSQRIYHWASNILETKPVKGNYNEVINQANDVFNNISKHELIQKLVANQIEHLNYSGFNRDLNEKEQYSKKTKSESVENTDRFFINLGKVDNLCKKDLLEFICEQAQIKEDDISNLRMEKIHSYFSVNKQYSKKVATSFKGLYIKERKIRVNRDN